VVQITHTNFKVWSHINFKAGPKEIEREEWTGAASLHLMADIP
jgi:hypothetical protein